MSIFTRLDGSDADEPKEPEVQRDRHGRPLVQQDDGNGATPYTRASTLAGTLDDTYALGIWQQRNVALGLARRPELIARIQTVEAASDVKRELGAIVDAAHDAAHADAGAEYGTALHAATEIVDAGEEIDPAFLASMEPEFLADLEAYQKVTSGFVSHEIEKFVVNDELKAAGTLDRLYSIPALTGDTKFIGDLKTSARIDSSGLAYAIQLATYAGGSAYDAGTGERTPMEGVSQEWGIIVHVPRRTGTAKLYWVDLRWGREMALLASRVRDERKRKDGKVLGYKEGQVLLPPGVIAVSSPDPFETIERDTPKCGIDTDATPVEAVADDIDDELAAAIARARGEAPPKPTPVEAVTDDVDGELAAAITRARGEAPPKPTPVEAVTDERAERDAEVEALLDYPPAEPEPEPEPEPEKDRAGLDDDIPEAWRRAAEEARAKKEDAAKRKARLAAIEAEDSVAEREASVIRGSRFSTVAQGDDALPFGQGGATADVVALGELTEEQAKENVRRLLHASEVRAEDPYALPVLTRPKEFRTLSADLNTMVRMAIREAQEAGVPSTAHLSSIGLDEATARALLEELAELTRRYDAGEEAPESDTVKTTGTGSKRILELDDRTYRVLKMGGRYRLQDMVSTKVVAGLDYRTLKELHADGRRIRSQLPLWVEVEGSPF